MSRQIKDWDEQDAYTRWRKMLFVALPHNAANPADRFGLPAERTVVMGSHVDG